MTTKTYRPSEQQEAVLTWALTGKGSLNLIARAGCGKSSTLKLLVPEILKQTPKAEIFIGAYNKAIAKEMAADIAAMGIPQRSCFVSTMHATGYIAWRRKAPKCQIDDKKVEKLVSELAQDRDDLREDIELFGAAIVRAVGFAKQWALGFLVSTEDRRQWFDIIDHFGMEEDLPEGVEVDLDRFVDICIMVYRESLRRCMDVIDFDDMILAPLVHNVFMYPKDWVMIDEAQDTNPARRALALKMLKPRTGRLIAVGDDRQAIYGFTGADADSMDQIKAKLNSAVLPLNKTFRCGKAIVTLAQNWVPDIQAADTNADGTVRTVWLEGDADSNRPLFWNEDFQPTDAILCRNNRPLVELAYIFLRKGVAVKVEGRDIGTGLIKLINRWKAKNLTALMPKVEEYRDREIQKMLAKGKEDRAAAIEDQCETVLVLAGKMMEEGKTCVSDLVDFILSLFQDTPEGGDPKPVLTLCSVHKSKGREWNKVYLLGRGRYMPSKYARKDWQIVQEDNLCYVAVTRAKNELVEVVVEK